MTTVRDIYNALFAFAPASMKMDWDNVGLLVGDPAQEVRRVLVALDITQGVAEEAVERGAQMIVSHHPVMNCAWHEVQTLRADDAQGRLLRYLVRHGDTLYTSILLTANTRSELIATFLAVLELIRKNRVTLRPVGEYTFEEGPHDFAMSLNRGHIDPRESIDTTGSAEDEKTAVQEVGDIVDAADEAEEIREYDEYEDGAGGVSGGGEEDER